MNEKKVCRFCLTDNDIHDKACLSLLLSEDRKRAENIWSQGYLDAFDGNAREEDASRCYRLGYRCGLIARNIEQAPVFNILKADPNAPAEPIDDSLYDVEFEVLQDLAQGAA